MELKSSDRVIFIYEMFKELHKHATDFINNYKFESMCKDKFEIDQYIQFYNVSLDELKDQVDRIINQFENDVVYKKLSAYSSLEHLYYRN
ncbi:hypothetical protein [Clostridium gasigenes]|uniref:Uncharacterized protein n=1 Tax=Clostridium gasigenes TaxID=94869 RepID=A0A1H0LTR3_9CLOT|nr:hypothetical protein [Clostridium gasigenes]SDO71485.1 hypothetical protein SAMN04488529_101198 [Clostridium gasigenes]